MSSWLMSALFPVTRVNAITGREQGCFSPIEQGESAADKKRFWKRKQNSCIQDSLIWEA